MVIEVSDSTHATDVAINCRPTYSCASPRRNASRRPKTLHVDDRCTHEKTRTLSSPKAA
jgi:hypothetical protein